MICRLYLSYTARVIADNTSLLIILTAYKNQAATGLSATPYPPAPAPSGDHPVQQLYAVCSTGLAIPCHVYHGYAPHAGDAAYYPSAKWRLAPILKKPDQFPVECGSAIACLQPDKRQTAMPV